MLRLLRPQHHVQQGFGLYMGLLRFVTDANFKEQVA